MKRLWIYILLFVSLGYTSNAQGLSRECAINTALGFMNSHNNGAGDRTRSQSFNASKLVVLYTSPNASIVAEENGGGFVLVCGTDNNPMVSGYGESSAPDIMESLSRVINTNSINNNNINQCCLWAIEDGFSLPIKPLVSSVRSQGNPFNRKCPYYIYDDGVVSSERCLVGCVATSAEQLVSYYKYPNVLQDSIAGFDSTNNGSIPTINAGVPLDFDNILDEYADGHFTETQANAVADLSYYLGVACRMSWGVGSSGANMTRLVEPLNRAFGYKYVRCLKSYDYSPRRWMWLLLNELSNSRPILFAGYDTNGDGHAFVIDGIDSEGYFHVTWGFGGDYDGYFDLSVLSTYESPQEPTEEGIQKGYSHLQQALFLYPDSVQYVVDDTLTTEHRLEVDTIIFNRDPDTNIYITAQISVKNLSDDDVFSPVELFTYTEVDSTGYPTDIDYLGLSDAIVKAHSDTTLISYLSFSVPGERYLGVNLPDLMYLKFDSVCVKKAVQPTLSFTTSVASVGSDSVSFNMSITNKSASYWSGRMITYSLFEDEYTTEEGDLRHYTVLNLPPGEVVDDYVSFSNLKPSTKYTFVVRNPWYPAVQLSIITEPATAVEDIIMDVGGTKQSYPDYRLNNRILIRYDESIGRYRQILSPQ